MKIQSELCHIDENRVVVKVIGWLDGKFIGSSLAEGINVEVTEERAIARLESRLKINQHDESPEVQNHEKRSTIKDTAKYVEIKEENSKKNQNKDLIENQILDWTNELTRLDLELKRIGWNKDQEKKFINRLLGYKSRDRITDYNELIFFLDQLKAIKEGSHPEKIEIKIKSNKLIHESDQVIKQLNWDKNKAREFLISLMGANSRSELSDSELEVFIKELKKKLKEK